MKNLGWYKSRFQAMSPAEIVWRISNSIRNRYEKKKYYSLHSPVTEIPLQSDLEFLHIDISKLPINWSNSNWSEFSELDLFSVFDYKKYKNQWNAGFQTENQWPEEPFSPAINISQRVDIGDIRTNWELNRHFQFAALAKSYYCTGKTDFLEEFIDLFSNWNQHNFFLHGVEWTSAMEMAIRVNSWVYAFAFLKKANCDESLLNQIEHGIFVMTDYITKHRARFSSANNHLIVEMYAAALVGILTGYTPWRDESLKILTEELPRQNYADGVNKEMSLHYQSFVMEAYGLLWLLMEKNRIEIPSVWKSYLTAMTEFVADSTDDFGTTMEFGDNDEGKILDLNGKIENHYQYILNLMGCLLDRKYTDFPRHENLYWIVPEEMISEKEKYIPGLVCCRREGGYTFLRSRDRRVLIGIDHADLGFGKIAAHGHADALSFQLFIDGKPIFADPGTYLYHCDPSTRNAFRSTRNHNTVIVDNRDQSEMLGAFLWGRKANAELLSLKKEENDVCLVMRHDGYAPVIHTRTLKFDSSRSLTISDEISSSVPAKANYIFGSESHLSNTKNGAVVIWPGNYAEIKMEGTLTSENDTSAFSPAYGIKETIECYSVVFQNILKTEIVLSPE